MSKEKYDKNKEALELSNGNDPLVKFSELTGIQSNLTNYIFESCNKDPNGISEKITIKELCEVADTSAPSVKKSILRLRDKNILFKGEYKDGRGGWTQYVLSRNVFDDMKELLTVDNKAKIGETETVDDTNSEPENAPIEEISAEANKKTVDKTSTNKPKAKDHHDEHHDHSFPDWVTFGHTENPIEAFVKIFAWLVFWTILEVLAIVQEFESFVLNMIILFGIAVIKCWFICSFFMHMKWDPPLVNYTASVPFFFLLVLFLAIGLTTPGAVDDLATICGF
jgi:caa(3)-type oxidase subunit IV